MDKPSLRILTFTTVFPNPNEPGNGPFVRQRILHLAAHADVQVLAPVPLLDYSNPRGDWRASRAIPLARTDGPLAVHHPRWLFPPLGTPINVACLYWGARATALALYRQAAFDCIDSHFGYPDGAAAALLARALRVPYFVTMRGNELVYSRDRLRRARLRSALLNSAGVIAVSEELRELALSLGVPPERTSTIPNGVDASVFFPRGWSEARAAFQLPPQRRVILSVGGLGPLKGHHRIVRALPSLIERGYDAELWIAGSSNRDGQYEAEIRKTIEQLNLGGRARLLGPIPAAELALRFSAADAFCLASSYEGCPNVVYEALACGCPVVSTRVGAVPQMIPSERYGLVIDVDNQPELETGLETALRRTWNREDIRLWGQSRGWPRVASEVLEFFRSRLTPKATPSYVRN